MSEGFRTHEITIERLATSQDAVGGQVRSWSTGNRGSLPKKAWCRASLMKNTEKLEHGIRGEFNGWRFLGEGDHPGITINDRIKFTFRDGEDERTVKVVFQSHQLSPESTAPWKCIGQEDTTEI